MYPFIPLFGLKIPSYGLMMAIAFASAILISYFRTRKAGLSVDHLMNIAIYAIISGLAGAYLLYIFVTYSFSEIIGSISDGSFYVFKDGGLVFYGGLIVGAVAAFVYCRVKKIKFSEYASVAMPTIPLAHALGRVGCFLAGCCYGKVMDSPLSVIYTNPAGGAPIGVPVFPIQLVEAACNIIIFIVLLIYAKKHMKSIGIFFLYLMMYAVVRFSLEYFRADEVRGIFLGIYTSQWISIAMFIAGAVGFAVMHRRRRLQGAVTDGDCPETPNAVGTIPAATENGENAENGETPENHATDGKDKTAE